MVQVKLLYLYTWNGQAVPKKDLRTVLTVSKIKIGDKRDRRMEIFTCERMYVYSIIYL